MNSIITKNGIWSSLFLTGVCVLPLLFLGVPEPGDFATSEIIGYASIVLSLVFVYIGMKQYRDANDESISYWKAAKVGLLIALFPAVTFGLYNLLYTEVIDPDFMPKWTEYTITERSAGKSLEEAAEIKKAVLAEQEAFSNPLIMFVMMFLTVYLIGIFISLVSAFFVKKS